MEVLYECGKGCTVTLMNDPRDVTEFVKRLEEISHSEGWTPGTAIADYARYAHNLAAVQEGRIVGGLQAMLGAQEIPFSFQAIWPEVTPANASVIAHVSILALERDVRGRESPFLPLCGELWRLCHCAGMEEIWHEVTPGTQALYRKLGWPLEVVGEERMHWNESCYLARMGMSDVAQALQLKARSSPANAKLVAQASRGVATGSRFDDGAVAVVG